MPDRQRQAPQEADSPPPRGALPIFFDPTSRRRRLLRAAGAFLVLGFLIWSVAFGLSLYVLGKLSAADQYDRARALPIALANPDTDDHAAAPSAWKPSAVPGLTYAYLPYGPEWNHLALAKALPQIDVLLPEWFRLDLARATLVPLGFERPHQRAVADVIGRKPALVLMPVVDFGDDETDPAAIAAALGSAQTVQAMIRSIVATAAERNYDGLCLDASEVPEDAYQKLTGLLAVLQERYRGTGRKTCIVAPLNSGLWSAAPLRHVVDRAIVLGFEDSATMAVPAPLAPQDWFVRRVDALLKDWDPAKVVLALGSLGYDWTARTRTAAPAPRTVTYAEAMRIAGLQSASVGFDRASLNTTYTYVDADFSYGDSGFTYSGGGRAHTVWLLDAVSLHNQLLAIEGRKLAGIAVWPLIGVDPSVWRMLQTRLPTADHAALMKDVLISDYVGYEGVGPFQQVLRTANPGRRSVKTDRTTGLIVDSTYGEVPEPYTILRYGAGRKGTIALTFDDGPDPVYTRQILDILDREKVPATFFVIGSNALRDPDIVARMVAAGHEIGVHTFFHPVLEQAPAWRVRFEVNAGERLIASITGRLTRVFRSPYGRSDGPLTREEERPIQQIEDYGFLVVGSDVTPPDWTRPSAASLIADVRLELDPDIGSVIELHDAGGDRSATVEALPGIIAMLRQQGYSFVPLSTFLGKTRDEIMPVNASVTALFDRASFGAIRLLSGFLTWAFWAVMILGIGRAITMLVLAHLRKRHATPRHDYAPMVTVVIPAFNEEPVIGRTLAAILDSDYRALDVLVVDDGSIDRTAEAVEAVAAKDPRVRLIRQPNAGKFAALNHAYRLIDSEIVVGIDADTIVRPDAIGRMAAHFQDPKVGAVAGNIKVSNRRSLITCLQALEYITSQNIDRRAAEIMNGIMVVPGALGAWRRSAVAKAGYYSPQTLSEDADVTVSVVRAGYRVVYEEAAIAGTEAPETVRQVLRQRLRWTLGMVQTAWKHRAAIAEGRWIGLVSIPDLLLFSLVMAVFAPIADLVFAAALVNYGIDALLVPEAARTAPSTNAIIGYAAFLGADALVALLAFRFEWRESKSLLLLLPLQRFFYRQLLYFSALRALRAALSGRLMRWQKVTRAPGLPEPTPAAPVARAARRQIQLTPR